MSTLQKNSTKLVRDLTDLRHRILDVKSEISWLVSAPPPKDELHERISSGIDYAASQFDFSALAGELLHRGKMGDLFKITAHSAVINGMVSLSFDMSPLLCRLFSDEIKNWLSTELNILNYEPGPPTVERPALIDAIRDRLHTLETEEEALISDAEKAGLDVARRTDADPGIILNAHSVHAYKYKVSPKHGDYFYGEIESDTQLTRAEIRTRTRHALPNEWTDAHKIERIEIIEPANQADILDGATPDPEDGPRCYAVSEGKTSRTISDTLKAGRIHAMGGPGTS